MTRYYRRRTVSPGCAIILAAFIIAAVISPWALLVLVVLALFLAAIGIGLPK